MILPELKKRPVGELLKSLDAYIEFAGKTNKFSDMYFYRELKQYIEQQVFEAQGKKEASNANPVN